MGIDEYNAICWWQAHETIQTTTVTLGELSRVLAESNSGLCHRLIETHGRATAAVTPQDYLGDSRSQSGLVLLEKVNSCLYIKGGSFEYDLRFIVIEAGVDAKHNKDSIPHLTAGRQIQEVSCSVHHDYCNMRRAGGRSPKGRLSRSKLVVGREILGERPRNSRSQNHPHNQNDK